MEIFNEVGGYYDLPHVTCFPPTGKPHTSFGSWRDCTKSIKSLCEMATNVVFILSIYVFVSS